MVKLCMLVVPACVNTLPMHTSVAWATIGPVSMFAYGKTKKAITMNVYKKKKLMITRGYKDNLPL